MKLHDYEYALIIGVIIGIFLLPTLSNIGLTARFVQMPAIALLGMPLVALAGLFVARLLVYKIPVLWQFAKFGLVGVSNTVIDFGVLNLLSNLTGVTFGFQASLIDAVAFLAALVNSYIWNSHWTFSNNKARNFKEFFIFFVVTFIGLLINTAVIYVVTKLITHPASISPKLWLNIAKLIATLTTMFWNFSGFKFLVFKE